MKKRFMLLLLTFVSANSHAEPLCADDLNSGKVIVDQSIKDFCVEARKDKVATLFTYDDPASEDIKNFKTDAEFNTFLKSTPVSSDNYNYPLTTIRITH